MSWRRCVAASRIASFVALLFVSSCREKVQTSLPQDQLIDILVDVHIAEAALQGLRQETRDSLAQLYYGQIYAIHQIEHSQLEQDMRLLREHPKLAMNIYEKVLSGLSKKEINPDKKGKDKKGKNRRN